MITRRYPAQKPTAGYYRSAAAILFALLSCPLLARADPRKVLDRLRQEACKQYQADFNRILGASAAQPWVGSFNVKLAAVDKTVGLIVADLEVYRADFEQKSLASLNGKDKLHEQPAIGALEIFHSQRDNFSHAFAMDTTGLSAADQATVLAYYEGYLDASIKYTDLYCQTVASVCTDRTRECIRLCMVLRLLRTPDAQWTQRDTDDLPFWLKPAPNLAEAELISLRAARLLTAYQIRPVQKKPTSASDDGTQYASYLGTAAVRLMQAGDLNSAADCLREGVRFAKAHHLSAIGPPLRSQLADLLSASNTLGSPQEIQALLDDAGSADEFAREALCYLKCLYANNDLAGTESSAGQYKNDARCQGILPQILYVGWAAARNDPVANGSEMQWRSEFLSRFPDHALGADMYFSDAMSALANGKYDDAKTKLRFIEYHYPDSKILPKVKEIEDHLASPR